MDKNRGPFALMPNFIEFSRINTKQWKQSTKNKSYGCFNSRKLLTPLQHAVQLLDEWPSKVSWENWEREPLIWWGKIPRGCSLLPPMELLNSPGALILSKNSDKSQANNQCVNRHQCQPIFQNNIRICEQRIWLKEAEYYPSGWCKIPTSNSTARAEAIRESPGRVTVHCWSKVRLEVDCTFKKFSR